VAASLTVDVRGEIAAYDVKVLKLAALKGVFADVVEEPVTYVNAPLLAEERGVEVQLTTDGESPDYRNLLAVRGTLASGEQISVSGTLSGTKQIEKLTEVCGFDIDVTFAPHLAFFRYDDRPGIVGSVGRILGDADVNIANMQVGPPGAGRRGADGHHRRLRDTPGGRRRHHRYHRCPLRSHRRHRGGVVTRTPLLGLALSAAPGHSTQHPRRGSARR
jgi:hypothetical protein